jgi:hypothetical protein
LSTGHPSFVVWCRKHCSTCFGLQHTLILWICLWDTAQCPTNKKSLKNVQETLQVSRRQKVWNYSVPQTKIWWIVFSRLNHEWGVSHRQIFLLVKNVHTWFTIGHISLHLKVSSIQLKSSIFDISIHHNHFWTSMQLKFWNNIYLTKILTNMKLHNQLICKTCYFSILHY